MRCVLWYETSFLPKEKKIYKIRANVFKSALHIYVHRYPCLIYFHDDDGDDEFFIRQGNAWRPVRETLMANLRLKSSGGREKNLLRGNRKEQANYEK